MAKAKQSSLSAEDLDHLRGELAAGRPPAVWFTSAAVGVEAGRSAKVLAFTDPPEGDYIQVRPTGAKDELSFSPAELTLEKPAPRRRTPPAPQPEPEPAAAAPTPVEHIYTPEPKPVPPKPAPKPAPAPAPAASPARAAGRKQPKPAEVTVTLTSTAEGEWTVDVQTGAKRVLRNAPIAASAVAQAAKLLLPEVDEAVETVLSAARERHLARVEQLRAELAAAQRALDELTG
ncbi:DUF6319 family protein [Actinosynnema sp. NPDC047251]|uniref:Translation initiation factor n=1 Tax=Saccharothrix espanaensis (strain ATCC 51144 / DSM 44229 / JCM 9112 / NBRC 15066 / NRRL 15764) TaxID=1179773 RepID=K0JYC8_SACES|nr:DUF6319 family protein [Saccharothrix espanaensis]CCH29208.1 hypothetical protein BN6_18880 [Saccharothrix espanaensis DSM 44229]